MYSDKKNILQLVALLIEHGVSNIVLCPGSRNSPIVHTLANHSFFNCHSVTDERSAGFFAVGLALHGGKPAAVCCTSPPHGSGKWTDRPCRNPGCSARW